MVREQTPELDSPGAHVSRRCCRYEACLLTWLLEKHAHGAGVASKRAPGCGCRVSQGSCKSAWSSATGESAAQVSQFGGTRQIFSFQEQ